MAYFPEDMMSLICLRNLRNSLKSGPYKIIYVTTGHINSAVLFTVPRQMFYSLFFTSLGYKSTPRAFCLHTSHCAGQKNCLGYWWTWNCLGFPLKISPPYLNYRHLLHKQGLSRGCNQNRIAHKMFFIAFWVVKIISSCFCGILALILLVLAGTQELQRKAYFK